MGRTGRRPYFRSGKTPRHRFTPFRFSWRGLLLRGEHGGTRTETRARSSLRLPSTCAGAPGATAPAPGQASLRPTRDSVRTPAKHAITRSADLREMRAALSFSQPTTPGKVVRCAPPPRPSAQGRDRPLPGRADRRGDRAGGDPPARCRTPALRDLDDIMKTSAATTSRRKPALTPDQIEALKSLRRHLRKGAKVYTILRHRSAEGTSRFIDLYVVKQNEPIRITWSAALLLEWSYSTRWEALRVDGCGTDVGFEAVSSLSGVLLSDNYALSQSWL